MIFYIYNLKFKEKNFFLRKKIIHNIYHISIVLAIFNIENEQYLINSK